ncbi:MAG: hypothetical protein V7641_3678 [Blastocatellia bacterium]
MSTFRPDGAWTLFYVSNYKHCVPNGTFQKHSISKQLLSLKHRGLDCDVEYRFRQAGFPSTGSQPFDDCGSYAGGSGRAGWTGASPAASRRACFIP